MRLQTDTLRVMGRAGRPVVNLQGALSVPQSAAEPEEFEVVQASDTSVTVYGGCAVRVAHGTAYPVPMKSDGGTTYDTADVKTLTGITSTGHVIAALVNNANEARPMDPDYVYVYFSTSWAASVPGDGSKWLLPLAKITCADGVITNIEQMHRGVWLSNFEVVDDLSLNYIEDAGYPYWLSQIYGWSDQAADAGPAETVELLWRAAMGGAAGYSQLIALLTAITDWTGVVIDGATIDNIVWDDAPPHADLDFATDADDRTVGADNYNHARVHLVKGEGVTDDQDTCNYVTQLGRAVDDLAIDLTSSLLIDASGLGTESLDWDNRWTRASNAHKRYNWEDGIFYDDAVDGYGEPTGPSIDHLLRTLDGNASASVGWSITSVLDIIEGTAASGALRCAGGGSFAKEVQATKFYLNGTNFASASAWDIEPSGTLSLAWTNLYLMGDEWERCTVADLSDTDLVLRRKPA